MLKIFKTTTSFTLAAVLALAVAPSMAAASWWNPPANQTASANADAGAGANNGASASGRHSSATAFDNKDATTRTQVDIPKNGWASGSAKANSGVSGGAKSSFADRTSGRAEGFIDMGTGGEASVTVNGRTTERGYSAGVFGGSLSEGSAQGAHRMTSGFTKTIGGAEGSASVNVPGRDSTSASAGMFSTAGNSAYASDRNNASVENTVGSGSSANASVND